MILLLFITVLGINNSYAQGIDFKTDTVSFDAANQAQSKFKNDLSSSGKKATSNVSIQVAKLKEIVDACAAKGIANVSFLIVSLRKEDTAQYCKHNPGMSSTDKNDLVGRQQLIIRVPRSAFFTSAAKVGKNQSSLMMSLLLMGLIRLDSPYGDLPLTDGDMYFGLGTICPPPSICN
jgi:hypothetical protein